MLNFVSLREKEKALFLIAWSSIVVNLALFVLKVGFGWYFHSYALVSDGVHSAGDSVTSAIVIFSIFIIRRKPSRQHPFGQQRMEDVASVIIAVLLAIAAIELLIPGVHSLIIHKETQIILHWSLWVVASVSIVLKEILFYVTKHIAKRYDSPLMHADAWHHRIDSITTALLFPAFIGSYFHIYWLDSAMSIVISLFIFKEAIGLLYTSATSLLGTRVKDEILTAVKEAATQTEKVFRMHDLIIHQYGNIFYASLHIEILSSLSSEEMHDIASDVASNILKILPEYSGCNVHVDPIPLDSARYKELSNIFQQFVIDHADIIIDYHDLHLRSDEDKEIINFEMTMKETDTTKYPELKQKITSMLMPYCGDSVLSFTLEPDHHYIV